MRNRNGSPTRPRMAAMLVGLAVTACGDRIAEVEPAIVAREVPLSPPAAAVVTSDVRQTTAAGRASATMRARFGLPATFTSRSAGRHQIHAPHGESLDAIAHELEHATIEFRRHFDHAPAAIHVVAFSTVDDLIHSQIPDLQRRALPVFPWFTETAFAEGAGGEAVGAEAEGALSHEAGHLFFKMFVDTRLPDPQAVAALRSDTYGHGLAPDWLDEAAALVSETDEVKQFHRAALGRDTTPIPIATLFAMNHPMSQFAADALAAKARAGESIDGPVILPRPGEDVARASLLFYAQCLSLAEYMTEIEGPGVLGVVTTALLQGDSMPQILARSRALPHDVAQLQRGWLAWAEARRVSR